MTRNFNALEEIPRLKDTREFVRRGDFEAAKTIAEAELAAALASYGGMAAETAPWRTVLVWIYVKLDDQPAYRAALEAEHALLQQLPKDATGYEHYGIGAINLAEVHINNGDIDVANRLLAIAEDAFRHVPNISIWLPAILLGFQGRVSLARGNVSLAEEQELAALQLIQGKKGPSLERDLLRNLLQIYATSGDHEAAGRIQHLLKTKLAPPADVRSFILGNG